MTQAKKKEDPSSIVQETTEELLGQLGILEGNSVQCRYLPEPNLYQVLIQSTRPALIIGFHGETLSSLQLILGQHLRSKLNDWVNLSINVNDYRERRESSLTAMADSVVDQVVSTGQPYSLPPLPANERRIIHMYLADHPQVVTASEGLGRSRCVIISPK
jgi:spoIIIJ-associated protein